MFLTYNLVSTVFYTGINVPYASLNGLMTQNGYERGLLGNFRMILSTAGTMTVNSFVLKMVCKLGDGSQWDQVGWTKVYVIIGIATIILNIFTFAVCKERVVEVNEDGNEKENISVIKSLKGLFTNKYWVLMLIALVIMYFMMSCFYGSAAYFVQYVMGDLKDFPAISNALSISQILTMFCTPFIMKKLKKRNTMLLGGVIQMLGFIGTGLAGANLTAQIVMSVVKGIGFGCGAAVMFGLLQDAITYGQWKNGYGSVGMGNAASSFGMKIGSGLGTAALGAVLSLGGFDAALEMQSSSALTAIVVSFAWIPVVTAILITICMIMFDLDKIYDQVITDLAEGKHKE